MLLQMALFHSFSWLRDIPLCVCVCVYTHTNTHTHHIFYIRSSVDGHRGGFPALIFKAQKSGGG